MPALKIGTRGSPLALAQAREARERLVSAHGLDSHDVEIVVISTTGDQVRDRPLAEIGGKGLFTKELEEALLAGMIDLAVHSMKDMPAWLPEGLVIGAVLPREDARDAFISLSAVSPADLKQGAVLGSSSVRRTAQILRLRPDLSPVQFRGNVETRLRKLAEGVADATFLACAGLNRLGLAARITQAMPIEEMLPAVAQGAIGLEIRHNDVRISELIAPLHHAESAATISCERAFLALLDGSCRTPLAGHARLKDGELTFYAQALTLDGRHSFEASRQGPVSDAKAMGRDAAAEIRARGGALLSF